MTGPKGGMERGIFITGEYVRHFTPDDRRNPFWKIYRQKKQDTIDLIRKIALTNSRKRILDVGGGMGRLSLQLSGSELGMIVLADISAAMLALAGRAREPGCQVHSVNADAQRLPFRDGSFEVVAALDLLCHLPEPAVALAEFHRVLTGGGTLILDSTNSNPLWAFFYPKYLGLNPARWLKIIRFGGVLPGWERIVRHYRKDTFVRLVRDAGFTVLGVLKYGPAVCPKWHLAISRKS
jgi:glycogen synthase